MSLFQYKVFESNGKASKGSLEADSSREARDKLRKNGMQIISIKKIEERSIVICLSKQELFQITRELGQMLKAHIPLFDSLQSLSDMYKQEKLVTLFSILSDRVKKGESLSKAMENYPQVFSIIYRKMVAVGEETGKLSETFVSMSMALEKELKIKKQILSSLAYPCIVCFFSLVVLFMLFFYVVPSLESLFSEKEVKGMSAFVFSLSIILRKYGIWILIFTLCISWFGFRWTRKQSFKTFWDSFVLKFPILKHTVVNSSLMRFSQNLLLTLKRGLSLVESLEIGKATMGNEILEKDIEGIIVQMKEGKSFSYLLNQLYWCPDLIKHTLSLGDQNGNLIEALEQSLCYFEEENDKLLSRLVNFITPILLIFTGVFVAFVMLAVLMPLTNSAALL
jgi:type II secretory pathway component PulF